jgi:hypothetical protein
MKEAEVAERPMGHPGAPPRSSSRSGGDDPLSVVLSDSEDESANAASTESWRQLQALILNVLRGSEKPLSIDTLAQRVGVGFLPLSEQVLALTRRNEVVLSGSPGKELVSLGPASTK